jgi:iron complex outermembrane receptor protein
MKTLKGFKGQYFSLVAILALSSGAVLASETKSIEDSKKSEEPFVVISKKIEVKEADAPFSTEVYTKKQIEKSHAKDVYEFLNTQTSIITMPTFGNSFSQKIDLRGYGLENGYQNIVVSVNGKKLNNIDMSPQLLSTIPIGSIQKIEIIKGSGSVEYGDGANAGVTNIVTSGYNGASINTYIGDNGLLYGSLGVGIKEDKFSISGYIDDYRHDGYKVIADDGTKDESKSQNKGVMATVTPIEGLEFNLGKSYSKMNINYANALSKDEYEDDVYTIPTPSFGSKYTHQDYDIDTLSYGIKYDITKDLKVNFQAYNEDKIVKYDSVRTAYNSQADYESDSYELKLNYDFSNFKTLFGVQKFDGSRFSHTNIYSPSPNEINKNSLAYFAKVNYTFTNSNFSLGTRGEKFDYEYKSGSKNLKDDYRLNAFDIGYNYKLSKTMSLFANYNKSYQAPDIDRFFNSFTGAFNSYIDPMKVDTYNIGFNHLSYPNKLKIAIFYASVKDEIYYDSVSGNNTNLDKTQKYGFEIYDKFNMLYNLYATLNYAYVDTKIKEDNNQNIVGNEIPGVSNHNVKVGLGYNPTHRISFLLSHTYKSSTYAMSDFDHSFGKMDSYNSTDVSASYKYKKFEIYAKVNNLFDKKNALFSDGGWSGLGVYPVNFERNFLVGLKAKF